MKKRWIVKQFKNIRQEVFDLYMNSLTSRNDYYKEKDIQLAKKIQHLIKKIQEVRIGVQELVVVLFVPL